MRNKHLGQKYGDEVRFNPSLFSSLSQTIRSLAEVHACFDLDHAVTLLTFIRIPQTVTDM